MTNEEAAPRPKRPRRGNRRPRTAESSEPTSERLNQLGVLVGAKLAANRFSNADADEVKAHFAEFKSLGVGSTSEARAAVKAVFDAYFDERRARYERRQAATGDAQSPGVQPRGTHPRGALQRGAQQRGAQPSGAQPRNGGDGGESRDRSNRALREGRPRRESPPRREGPQQRDARPPREESNERADHRALEAAKVALVERARAISADDSDGQRTWNQIINEWKALDRRPVETDPLWHELTLYRNAFRARVEANRSERALVAQQSVLAKSDLLRQAATIAPDDRGEERWERLLAGWAEIPAAAPAEERRLSEELAAVQALYRSRLDSQHDSERAELRRRAEEARRRAEETERQATAIDSRLAHVRAVVYDGRDAGKRAHFVARRDDQVRALEREQLELRERAASLRTKAAQFEAKATR